MGGRGRLPVTEMEGSGLAEWKALERAPFIGQERGSAPTRSATSVSQLGKRKTRTRACFHLITDGF